MRKIIAMTAAGLLAAVSTSALASSDDGHDRGRRDDTQHVGMSVHDVTAKVTNMGYQVRKVERDDGYYEVDAIDKGGQRIELKMDPRSGRVVKRDGDS